MLTEQKNLARRVINALVDDWMLVEEVDDDTHLILVDESRNEMEDLRPRRDFIVWLEQEGLIENFGLPLDEAPTYGEITHTYPDGRIEIHPFRHPHVFDFRPTAAGFALLSADATNATPSLLGGDA
jgi:hypothetical protein